MQLFIHAGLQRTATTAIQSFLSKRRGDLAARGVLVPFGTVRHDAITRRLLARDLTAEGLADQIEAEVSAQTYDVKSVILTDEDLVGLPDFGVLEGLARRFDVAILTTLRRQDQWLESWYLQNVRWQWNPLLCHLTLEEFVARRAEFGWLDFENLLAAQERALGHAAVCPAVYDGQSPLAGFLARVGLGDLADLPEARKVSNASTSALMAELLRRLPLDGIEPEERSIIETALVALDRRIGPGDSRLIMDHGLRSAVMAEYAPGNENVAKRWFQKDSLFAPLPGPAEPLAERRFAPEAEALISRFVAPMIEELGEAMTLARMRRRKLEKN